MVPTSISMVAGPDQDEEEHKKKKVKSLKEDEAPCNISLLHPMVHIIQQYNRRCADNVDGWMCLRHKALDEI